MNKKLNILICPLEWGLGHSGRMIPLVKKLSERQNRIFIGSGTRHQAFFRSELTGLTFIDFPGFNPGYSRYLPQYLHIFLQTPLLLFHIVSEHYRLKKIIHDYNIDIVISDNRAGLWNKDVLTAYVTHQPLIPLPEWLKFLEWIGILSHRFFMMKYSLCLIPDLPGEINLTGRLTHGVKLPRNTRFIGILSRFDQETTPLPDTPRPDYITLMLSGPEPQKSILRKKITAVFKHQKLKAVVLEGRPENTKDLPAQENIVSYDHLPAAEMKKVLLQSKCIVSRSGYTTIMELVSLKLTALLIPTPGQTEQEYLARYLSEKGWFRTVTQKRINETISFSPGNVLFPSAFAKESTGLLEKALDELLDQENKESYPENTGKESEPDLGRSM